MHRRGGESFSLAGRREDSSTGNSWRKDTKRRSSRQDCIPERREELHCRETEHELSAKPGAFWIADDPRGYSCLRGRKRPVACRPRLDGNHAPAYCGCNCGCGQIPRPEKFFSRDNLWLWRAEPCSTARAFSDASAPKGLRIRCRFKRIAAFCCRTFART